MFINNILCFVLDPNRFIGWKISLGILLAEHIMKRCFNFLSPEIAQEFFNHSFNIVSTQNYTNSNYTSNSWSKTDYE